MVIAHATFISSLFLAYSIIYLMWTTCKGCTRTTRWYPLVSVVRLRRPMLFSFPVYSRSLSVNMVDFSSITMSSVSPHHGVGSSARKLISSRMVMIVTDWVWLSICLYFVFLASPSINQRNLNLSHSSDTYRMHRAPPDLNYTGAAIFVAYIVAALVLSFTILKMIYNRAQASIAHIAPARYRLVQVLGFCALLSFVVLSGNMLGFLIASYQAWETAVDTRTLQTADLNRNIWQWMTTSSLFLDFAKSLCNSPGGFYWSKKALSATLYSYILVGCLEQIYQTHRAWIFIMLAQILPISFSLNLFFIYLLLEPQNIWHRADSRIKYDPKTSTGTRIKVVGILSMQCFLYFHYSMRLNQLSGSTKGQNFLTDVLLTRLLLLAAYLTPVPAPRVLRSILLHSILPIMSASFLLSLRHVSYWTTGYNRAVETMRYDLIIWLLSIIVWTSATTSAHADVSSPTEEENVKANEERT